MMCLQFIIYFEGYRTDPLPLPVPTVRILEHPYHTYNEFMIGIVQDRNGWNCFGLSKELTLKELGLRCRSEKEMCMIKVDIEGFLTM